MFIPKVFIGMLRCDNGGIKLKDKRMLIVMSVLMITFIGFGIIIPVMPEIIQSADPVGAELHTGRMLALYSAVSFLLSPIWGNLSDRVVGDP